MRRTSPGRPTCHAGGRWHMAVLLAALLVWGGADAAPASDAALEYRVKAAFLFNFARFVTWPPQKFADARAPVQLCVLGPDPFGAVLDDTVRGKTIDGRSVVVHRATRAQPLRDCHVLYAAGVDSAELERLIEPLQGSGALIVHEAERALAGGSARFLIDQGKVRFEINTAAVARERLQVSAKLLSLAQVVQE